MLTQIAIVINFLLCAALMFVCTKVLRGIHPELRAYSTFQGEPEKTARSSAYKAYEQIKATNQIWAWVSLALFALIWTIPAFTANCAHNPTADFMNDCLLTADVISFIIILIASIFLSKRDSKKEQIAAEASKVSTQR